MTVDNSFSERLERKTMNEAEKALSEAVPKKEEMIVAFCMFTNMPFIVCDPETCNDQVWIFDTEEQLQEFAKPYIAKKILLRGVKYPNKAFLTFFSMLFTIGVNELVFVSENGKNTIDLDKLIRRPDLSQLPKHQQPLLNPELQLTGLYFMQEANRPIKLEDRAMEEKRLYAELEEELTANLFKASYLMPIELEEGPETEEEKLRNRKFKPMVIVNKPNEQAGQKEPVMFQVLFTDPNEMIKMNKDNKYRAITVPFKLLTHFLLKNSKGYILNPMGFRIAMTPELLKRLQMEFETEDK